MSEKHHTTRPRRIFRLMKQPDGTVTVERMRDGSSVWFRFSGARRDCWIWRRDDYDTVCPEIRYVVECPDYTCYAVKTQTDAWRYAGLWSNGLNPEGKE